MSNTIECIDPTLYDGKGCNAFYFVSQNYKNGKPSGFGHVSANHLSCEERKGVYMFDFRPTLSNKDQFTIDKDPWSVVDPFQVSFPDGKGVVSHEEMEYVISLLRDKVPLEIKGNAKFVEAARSVVEKIGRIAVVDEKTGPAPVQLIEHSGGRT